MGRSFRRVWPKDNLVSDIIAQVGQDRNGRLYLVWYTEGSGEPSIHLATSDAALHRIRAGNLPHAPVIAVSGTGRVYGTWYESSRVVSRVFRRESSDRGRTIGAPQQLNVGPRRAHHAVVALGGGAGGVRLGRRALHRESRGFPAPHLRAVNPAVTFRRAAALTRDLKPGDVVEPMPKRLGRRRGSMMRAFKVVIVVGLVGFAALTWAQQAPAPRKYTMEELHRSGGVPHGWRFALPTGDPVKGRQVFADLECYKCHTIRGEPFPASGGDAKNAGPELTGMGSHHPAEYFAESILAPHAVVLDGPGYTGRDGKSIMPSYADSLSVTQLLDLVAYLRSLTDGEGGHQHGVATEQASGDYTVRLAYESCRSGHEMHGMQGMPATKSGRAPGAT